jgi:hypothetical protein
MKAGRRREIGIGELWTKALAALKSEDPSFGTSDGKYLTDAEAARLDERIDALRAEADAERIAAGKATTTTATAGSIA